MAPPTHGRSLQSSEGACSDGPNRGGVREQRRVPALDFEQISGDYFPRIHRAALLLCGNPWDADDLAQETFLVAARQQHTFRGRSSVYTWLYAILLNLERQARRRQGRQRHGLQVLWAEEGGAAPTAPSASTELEVAEWKAGLWSAVAQLPDGQRQALVLRYGAELGYNEMAETMGCPLGTAKSRVFHGLQALRRMLEQRGQPSGGAEFDSREDRHRAI